MLLKAYSIHDNAVKSYNNPFYMLTHAEACRAFKTEALNPESKICNHPQDFSLYYVGTYDNASATFNQSDGISLMITATEIQQSESQGSPMPDITPEKTA